MKRNISIVDLIAKNPASVLILFGFFILLMAMIVPLGIGIQILVGWLGFFTLIIGIIVHALWLKC